MQKQRKTPVDMHAVEVTRTHIHIYEACAHVRSISGRYVGDGAIKDFTADHNKKHSRCVDHGDFSALG